MEPAHVGWGGYFEFGLTADDTTHAFTNHKNKAHEICLKYENYFYPATFNNFMARMDWADKGTGNRNPNIKINGSNGVLPIQISKNPGDIITFDATKSSDPDNDKLYFKWWVLPEAGSYQKKLIIPNNTSSKIKIKLPPDSSGKDFHIICEVTDNGEPRLTSYRRIIIKLE